MNWPKARQALRGICWNKVKRFYKIRQMPRGISLRSTLLKMPLPLTERGRISMVAESKMCGRKICEDRGQLLSAEDDEVVDDFGAVLGLFELAHVRAAGEYFYHGFFT